jgi:hypothetical protein
MTWREGLFLVRSSIFAAVLTWLAQLWARSFVKAQLLPAACAALSEYLQRDVRLGEVRSVSPLGVTLQTFSIGPHREEFSCTEVPVMKIRARPFTSLRRGKVVIDAVLSEPSVLVSGERASARDQQETVAAYSLETASTPSRMTQRVWIFLQIPPPPWRVNPRSRAVPALTEQIKTTENERALVALPARQYKAQPHRACAGVGGDDALAACAWPSLSCFPAVALHQKWNLALRDRE